MSVIDQILEEIVQKNKRIELLNESGMPQVGIFWFINHKIIADTIPWKEGIEHSGFYNGTSNHQHLWKTLKQVSKDLTGKFTDHDRGRVVYNSKKDQWLIYGPKKLMLNNTPTGKQFRDLVVKEFNLPKDKIKWKADIHYEDPDNLNWEA
ncbi:MAG: hypothetical protein HQK91_14375 [Nitrospirae bacterium]|nr:hypothetical protein [Nitrospirota bacterium]